MNDDMARETLLYLEAHIIDHFEKLIAHVREMSEEQRREPYYGPMCSSELQKQRWRLFLQDMETTVVTGLLAMRDGMLDAKAQTYQRLVEQRKIDSEDPTIH